jgi:hypothetical protein
MPGLFSKLAQVASDAGNIVARTAANAHDVLSDRDLRRCSLASISRVQGRRRMFFHGFY